MYISDCRTHFKAGSDRREQRVRQVAERHLPVQHNPRGLCQRATIDGFSDSERYQNLRWRLVCIKSIERIRYSIWKTSSAFHYGGSDGIRIIVEPLGKHAHFYRRKLCKFYRVSTPRFDFFKLSSIWHRRRWLFVFSSSQGRSRVKRLKICILKVHKNGSVEQ